MTVLSLMKEWGDALLKLQLTGTGDKRLDGGILCPACKHIHGRCADAVYGLMAMTDATGDRRYLDGARALFQWQANMFCDDGSLYNDGGSAWNGITTFAFVSLHEALALHGQLLEADEKKRWEERMLAMCRWVSENIGTDCRNNINYLAASAAVQAMAGKYFGLPEYLEKAEKLAQYVMAHFTENGLLCGEGLPHDGVTKRGCRPVDIGYNVEESVPLLVRYALAAGDEPMLEKLTVILKKQLAFMLPDGSWDNSFGTRSDKWTYYGSRTSDGCQSAYALLADRDPLFAEAARRSTELMARCTDGLLYGGPEYQKYGEPPCSHHTFTHINALAAALDAGLDRAGERTLLPCDRPAEAVRYFPEIDTYKLSLGKWRATVTGYDFFSPQRKHASGGTMTLLWHEDAGPVLLSSVTDYQLAEPFNMQLPLNKSRHRPLTMRLERLVDGVRYASCYDTGADICTIQQGEGITVGVSGALVTIDGERPPQAVSYNASYLLQQEAMKAVIQLEGGWQGVRLVLPVIADAAVLSPMLAEEPEQIFFLTGGFGAKEYILLPDAQGRITFTLSAPRKA